MTLDLILLNLTINCLDISSLHSLKMQPKKETCMVMDQDRQYKILDTSCNSIYNLCNSLFLSHFKIMCSGKECESRFKKVPKPSNRKKRVSYLPNDIKSLAMPIMKLTNSQIESMRVYPARFRNTK